MSHQPDFGTDGDEMVTSMYSAIVEDKTERLRSLIEEGADVNASILCELLVVTTFNFIIKINLTSLVEMLMLINPESVGVGGVETRNVKLTLASVISFDHRPSVWMGYWMRGRDGNLVSIHVQFL